MQLFSVLLLSTCAIMQVTGLPREASELSPSPSAPDSPPRLLRRIVPTSNVFNVQYNNVFGQQETEVTCSASGDSPLDGGDVVVGTSVANAHLQAPGGVNPGNTITASAQTQDPHTGAVNTITLDARTDQRIGPTQIGTVTSIAQTAVNRWVQLNPNGAAAILILSFLLNNAHVYLTYTFGQTLKGGHPTRQLADPTGIFTVSDFGQQYQVHYSTSGSCPLNGVETRAISSMLNEHLLSENSNGIQPGTPAHVDIPQQNINNQAFKASLSVQTSQSLDTDQFGKVVDVANNALVQISILNPNLGVSVLDLTFSLDSAQVSFAYDYQQI